MKNLVDEVFKRLLRLILAPTKNVFFAAKSLVLILPAVARILLIVALFVHLVLQHYITSWGVVATIKCPNAGRRGSSEVVSSFVLRHLKVCQQGVSVSIGSCSLEILTLYLLKALLSGNPMRVTNNLVFFPRLLVISVVHLCLFILIVNYTFQFYCFILPFLQ